jgi:tetratricopeptide (TPR) repeat protein
VALFERALHMSGEEAPSPEERVRALTARALMSWHRQDLESAARVAEEARRLAADWGLGPELGEASTLLGLVAWARGSWPDLFRTESMEVFRRAPEQAAFVLEGHLCFAEAALYGANSEAVASLARELLGSASAVGSLYGQALMTLLIGETDLIAGRLAQAQEHLSHAMSLYAGIGGISGQVLAMTKLAEVAAATGRGDEANRLLAQARPLAAQSELVSHLLVRVFAGLIQATKGRRMQLRVVEDAERTLPQVGICGPCSINFWITATIACTRAEELAKSRTCLREAERLTGMWQGGPWQAATWEARAALRLAEGDRTQSEALLREAEELFTQSGRPLDAARCHAAIVKAHRQAVAVSS